MNISGFTIRNTDITGIKICGEHSTISNNIISHSTDTRGYSTGIEIFSSFNTIAHNTISSWDNGIHMESCNNTIFGNTITNSHTGIDLLNSDDNNISCNNISGVTHGIHTRYSENNIFSENTISNIGLYGITLAHYSNNNSIAGNTISSCREGIRTHLSSINIFNNNTIKNCGPENGMSLWDDSSNTTISYNTFEGNGGYSLVVYGPSNNMTIQGNIFNNNKWGLRLGHGNNNTIQDNTFYNTDSPIDLVHSGYNVIYNNTIHNHSICVRSTGNNIVSDNTLTGSSCILLWSSNNNVFNNTLNGGYISVGGHNIVYNNTISNCSSAAGIHIGSNSIITHNIISDCSSGIGISGSNNIITQNIINNNVRNGFEILWSCCNNIIDGNIINNSNFGFEIAPISFNSNTISNNIISNNSYSIRIDSYGPIINNTIAGNIISNNGRGIYMWQLDYPIINNTIVENTFRNNGIGIFLWASSLRNNSIYHNNFVNNTYHHAWDEGSNNWDKDYHIGGNYWDDYTGSDSDGDGIGDQPYNISGGNNQDRYPLMVEFPAEHDIVVLSNLSSPIYALPDIPFQINVTIYNQGKNNESNILVNFSVNHTVVDNETIDYLEKNNGTIVSFNFTFSLGVFDIGIDVKPLSDEIMICNNFLEWLMIVGPDVAITDIDVPKCVYVNETVEINATIENPSRIDVSNVSLILRIDNVVVENITISSLASGEIVDIILNWTPCENKWVDFSLYIEAVNNESYLINNFYNTTYYVINEYHTVYVDDDGGAEFITIQEAIDVICEGDTVYVFNGTYYENVVVNKSISLIGENRSHTIIDGRQSSNDVVSVYANLVNISGFTIQNGGFGIYLYSWTRNNNISGNIISSNIYSGIRSYSDHCNILDNIISSNNDHGISIGGSNSNISGNTTCSNNGYGIRLACSNNNIISDNLISSNNLRGIDVYISDDNSIFSNNIIGNDVGITCIIPMIILFMIISLIT